MSISEFFDYEKNLNNLLNNKNEIEIFNSPKKKRYRKKTEDEQLHYDFENKRLTFMKKENEIKKTDTLINEGRRRRGYSHKIKRNNNNVDFIIKDIDPKDEISDNPSLFFKKSTLRTHSSSKKNCYKYRKKKVSFKHKFVNIIEVENFKKYNVNDDFYNNKAKALCSCIIY